MDFTVSYELPENVAETLRQNWSHIAKTNLEDIAVISYRAGILTSHQVQLMLDHDSRWETEEFLHRHRCHLHYDEANFRRDGEVLKEMFGNRGLQ